MTLLALACVPLAPGGAGKAEAAVGMRTGIDIRHANSNAATSIAFGGKEWVVIGYDGAGVQGADGPLSAVGDDTATLFLKIGSSYGEPMAFSATDATYEGSNLQLSMEAAYDSLGAGEQALVRPRTLAASMSTNGDYSRDFDTIYGPSDVSARFWPLSSAEGLSTDGSLRPFGNDWWLRSPGLWEFNVAAALANGDVEHAGASITDSYAPRPAFKLDLSTVLFTSSADGSGKGSVALGSTLTEVEAPVGTIKITAIDEGGLALANIAVESSSGRDVTLAYAGATANATLSAVVLDNVTKGAVLYGKLAAVDATGVGKATLAVPEGYDPETHSIKVFVEELNADAFTDFASAPVALDLSKLPVPAGLGSTPASSATARDGAITGTSSAMEYKLESDGAWTDAAGASVTGLAAGTYEVRSKASDVVGASDAVRVTVGVAVPAKADAAKNGFAVSGGLTHAVNADFTITAVGDRQDATGLVVGDTRFVPEAASANPTVPFADAAPYTATMRIAQAGTYTLSVTFAEQVWDGGSWTASGTIDEKTATLTIAVPEPLPSASTGGGKLARTGDGTLHLPAAFSLLALSGAALIVARRASRG